METSSPKLSLRDPRLVRELTPRVLLTLLVMLAPLLVAVLLTALRGQNIFRAVPLWNDERWWYAQYAAISRFGRPLGYFGYAGTHARVGTWGPWGMYPLLLTGLFARVFGWGLHAHVYYNFLFLALAGLIFVLLTKPSLPALWKLAAANAAAYIAICYAPVCMNETVRYAMALVLTGLMYRIIAVPEVSRARMILRCTLVPLLLLYATAFYLILGAFLPVYLYFMLRRLKPWQRLVIALPVSAAAIRLLRRLNAVTCCPYITGDSSFSLPADTLRLKLMNAYYSILGNAKNIDPFYLLSRAGDGDADPVLLWFCVLLYLTMGLLVWRLLRSPRDPERRTEHSLELTALYLTAAFWAGHIVMYNTTDWTFMRGCFTALYCAVMLCALLPRREGQPWLGAMVVCVLGVVTFAGIFTSEFTPAARFTTPRQDEAYAARRQALEQVIVLDKTAPDPWDNTVTTCGIDEEFYYSLPWGAGVNGAVEDVINENARYVAVGMNYGDPEARAADIEKLRQSGHEIVYEDDALTILKNSARDQD